jgi:hypothetical protein
MHCYVYPERLLCKLICWSILQYTAHETKLMTNDEIPQRNI